MSTCGPLLLLLLHLNDSLDVPILLLVLDHHICSVPLCKIANFNFIFRKRIKIWGVKSSKQELTCCLVLARRGAVYYGNAVERTLFRSLVGFFGCQLANLSRAAVFFLERRGFVLGTLPNKLHLFSLFFTSTVMNFNI